MSGATAAILGYAGTAMKQKHAQRRRIGATGVEVTQLGFGAAALGNLFVPVADEDARATMAAAIEGGLRYFDTAPYYGYGLSERRVGNGLTHLPADAYVLSTKMGRLLRADAARPAGGEFADPLPFGAVFDYSRDGALRSLEDSLQRLGLAHVDIALVHDLDPTVHDDHESFERRFAEAVEGALPALSELRAGGVVSAIGLGINDWRTAERFLEAADLDVVLLAGRYTMLEQAAAETFLPNCAARGVSVIIGGPFNSGILAQGPSGGAQGPHGGAMYNYAPAAPAIIERVRRIDDICAGHGVPLAAAALQFSLGHPAVVSVIPGMRNAAEVTGNIALMNLPIPSDCWRELQHEGLIGKLVALPPAA